MSLREAAAIPEADPPPEPKPSRQSDFWSRTADRSWEGYGFEPPPGFEDRWGRTRKADDPPPRGSGDDKRQWRAAYEAARRRGLDREEEAAAKATAQRRTSSRPKSDRRMNPYLHARTLLRETTLPLSEIATITRLSIYQVVGLKLKMREEDARARRVRA